ARTGAERARFAAPARDVGATPSRDGRRVLLQHRAAGPGFEHHEWYLVDAADGRMLARGEADETAAQTWADPDLRRLYRVLMPINAPGQRGPEPVAVVAYDLASGAEVGRLALPDVRGGFWPTDRVIG